MKKFIGVPDTLVPSMYEGIMEYRYWIDVKKNMIKGMMKQFFFNITYSFDNDPFYMLVIIYKKCYLSVKKLIDYRQKY